MDEACGCQKTPNENRCECDFGSDYQRSRFLKDLEVNFPFDLKVFKTKWIRKDRIRKGTLDYCRNEERNRIDVCRAYENCFNSRKAYH